MSLTRITSDLQDTYNYPLICDDISSLFDGITMIFPLDVDGIAINTVIDSRNVQVYVNGQLQRPYVSEKRLPWIMEYAPNGAYKVVNGKIIFFNPPASGDVVTISVISASIYVQRMSNSYTTRPIAFGD